MRRRRRRTSAQTLTFLTLWMVVQALWYGAEASAASNVSLVGDAAFYCLPPAVSCLPSIRLTSANANKVGAAWASLAAVDATADFTIEFMFMLTAPSPSCPVLQGAYKHCLTRGGHGFALVLQNRPIPLGVVGSGGSSLGYGGIVGSVSLEFDTWYNPEYEDLYDNHMSLQALGPVAAASPHHLYTLAQTADIPDLQDGGIHTVKMVYSPALDTDILHPSLCKGKHACELLQSTFHLTTLMNAGLLDAGMGTISVFLDDMVTPRFIAPIFLPGVMDLSSGNNLTVGFTAATSAGQWQNHDILDWAICSPSSSCTPVFDF